MSYELYFDDIKYVSTREAAKLTGYNHDYIGRLCRTGAIDGRRLGARWYVNERSLGLFLMTQDQTKALRRKALSQQRKEEYRIVDAQANRSAPAPD